MAQTDGGAKLGEHRSAPRLRLKPSSSKLRTRTTTTTLTPPAPSSSNATASNLSSDLPGNSCPSAHSRLDARRASGGLPKQMAPDRTGTPAMFARAHTAPPTKHHAAFSLGSGGASNKVSSTLGSSGATSSLDTAQERKAPGSGKRLRRVISRKNSAAGEDAYALASLRAGSTTSLNGSAISLSSSTSSLAGAPRNASQTSVLGLTPPATSAASKVTAVPVRKLSEGDASDVPRPPFAREFSTPVQGSSPSDSSPSTGYTGSPGGASHISTPTSTTSYCSVLSMPKAINTSPKRPSLKRSVSEIIADAGRGVALAERGVGLASVRESTTSTSSSSTIKAGDRDRPDPAMPPHPEFVRPPSPPVPRSANRPSGTASAPATPSDYPSKSPKLAPSPHFYSSKSSLPVGSSIPTRRKPNAGSVPSRTTRDRELEQGPTGLGLNIPTLRSGATPALCRDRSKSLGSSSLQQKRKPSPPPPSPSVPPDLMRGRTASAPSSHPSEKAAVVLGADSLLPPKVASSRGASTIKQGHRKEQSTSISTSTSKSSPSIKPGFFSRSRSKSTTQGPQEKLRKGPAAGTGHEGYGPFAKARGRSGSISSTSGSYNRSVSTGSMSGSRDTSRRNSKTSFMESDMDDYLLGRLKPVVILGGGVVENRNVSPVGGVDMSRTGSDQSSKQSVDSGLGGDSVLKQHRLPALSRQNSSDVEGSTKGKPVQDKGTSATRKKLGFRRTQVPIPPPINTTGRRHLPTPSPAISSASSGSSRKPSIDRQGPRSAATDSALQFGREWDRPAPPTKTKRWNFLQRAHPTRPAPPTSSPATLDRSFPPKPSAKRPAHYAILDQEEQREAAQLAEQLQLLRKKHSIGTEKSPNFSHTIWQQHNAPSANSASGPIPPPPAAPRTKSLSRTNSEALRQEVRQKMADERKRRQLELSREPSGSTPEKVDVPQKPKLPPLQTGVPHVADTREWSAPPETSHTLSQDFQVNWSSSGLTPISPKSRPITSKEFLKYDPFDIRGQTARPETLTDHFDTLAVASANTRWPVRKESINVLETRPIASVPEVEQEDIWEEYDDITRESAFFPRVLAPPLGRSGTVTSSASSLGSPFQYADDIYAGLPDPHDSPTIDEGMEEEEAGATEKGIYTKDSPTIPPTIPKQTELEDLDLSKTSPAQGNNDMLLRPTTSPTTPFSISSFGSLGKLGSVENTPKFDTPKRHKASNSDDSTSSSGSYSVRGLEDEMKIRPWALLASRWLLFDRVLVSPAHEKSDGPGRVLVVDGLGIDDWSFYCAHSYPKAKVYNLTKSPVGYTGLASSPCASPSAPKPANHHQIYHSSFSTALPFPKGFFDVVCFRFLPSTSEAQWPYVLTECKRVLKAGGYLETIILDADLMSIGSRALRAVDLVKAIMEREGEGCKKRANLAASEKVLKILQKRGFEEIKKCFIGLPVVGKVDPATVGSAGGAQLDQSTRERSPEDPDAIYEVVSKVGRWWYTRCYESVITGYGDAPNRSMWNDKALLRECAKKRTNFKMMICHARKPVTPARTPPL